MWADGKNSRGRINLSYFQTASDDGAALNRWLNFLDGCFANSYLDKNLVWQGIVYRAVGNIVCEVSQFIGKHKQAVCIILIWLTLDAV
ncbi:hypothetical protein PL75_00995 [Neisseria arctica]|uniref:Uncharacterized protein n=1 Tax=Neisseria arctica TaxID=1470200 RepID=A0A0J0YV28_9NEIS|nr:hypothetical protein PL75_00995 [Neisseria arctica]